MRKNLINAREGAQLSPREISKLLGITERFYRYIENGDREGKGYIWDRLQDLFHIDQKELRRVSQTKEAVDEDGQTTKQSAGDATPAANNSRNERGGQ
jgi:transcriptional regulator with XRE-family HTH domain